MKKEILTDLINTLKDEIETEIWKIMNRKNKDLFLK